MAKKVLIPVDSSPAASNAFEAVHEMLPEDSYVVFVRVLTPSEDATESQARAGLVKCLMVYRTRGIDSDMRLIEAESTAAGIADAVTRSDIDEILCIRGHGADDPTGLIDELKTLTDVPISATEEKREATPIG